MQAGVHSRIGLVQYALLHDLLKEILKKHCLDALVAC
jgi:hypothetical protein